MSRRRKSSRHSSHATRWAIGAVCLLLLAVASAATAYWLIQRYLRSDDFRSWLSSKTSATLGIRGEFQPFQWDGFSVRSPGFQASGPEKLRQLHLTSLQTEIGLQGIRRGVWLLTNTRLQQLDVELNAGASSSPWLAAPAAATTATPAMPGHRAQGSSPSWLPDRVELDGMTVESLSARFHTDHGMASAQQIRLEATPVAAIPHAWDVSLRGGTITPPPGPLPPLRLDSASLRYNGTTAYLTQCSARAWENTQLSMSGELHPTSGESSLEGRIESAPCQNWLNESWSRRLTGEASSHFHVRTSHGSAEAAGDLEIRNAVLTALPILDSLAAYADTRRFRTLMLNDARMHWRWKPGEWHFSQLQFGSEGLVRLEGHVSIIQRNLSGTLRIGLVPGTLAHIPGAETRVFQPGERNLLWTTIQLGGTIDQPREDLSDRLLLAAGSRMLETLPDTGQQVLKHAGKLVGDVAPAALNQGKKLLESGETIIQQGTHASGLAGEILNHLLPEPNPAEPSPAPSDESR